MIWEVIATLYLVIYAAEVILFSRRISEKKIQKQPQTFHIFNVQVSVQSKFIPFDIFPTRCNFTQFIYFWKTALYVSGGISTYHQEHIQLYLQYLVLV